MAKIKIWHPVTHRIRIVERHSGIVTCGNCGRSWDDTISTEWTPAPSGRCPFEGMRRTTARPA
jgi:hypothetical protein